MKYSALINLEVLGKIDDGLKDNSNALNKLWQCETYLKIIISAYFNKL